MSQGCIVTVDGSLGGRIVWGKLFHGRFMGRHVLNSGEGVCADPVVRGAILEVKGPGPPSGVSEGQLSPDRGGEKT
jgi:hypothetical protein